MQAISDFLFARPSFLGGAARVLDMGNVLTEFNQSPSAEIANEIALKMDWDVVGQTMREAIAQFEQENRAAIAALGLDGEATEK